MKRAYRKLPVWVHKVHEVRHCNGKVFLQVTTKTGKPRTIRVKR